MPNNTAGVDIGNPILQQLLQMIQAYYPSNTGGAGMPAPKVGGPLPLNYTIPTELQPFLSSLTGAQASNNQTILNGGQTADTINAKNGFSDILNGLDPATKALLVPMQQTLQYQGLNGSLNNAITKGQSIINGNGHTAEGDQSMAVLQALQAAGGLTPELASLMAQANGIVSSNGMNPVIQQLLSGAGSVISSGGMNSAIAQLMGSAQGLVSSGGMTPALNDLLKQVDQIYAKNGFTDENKALYDKMMAIVNAGGEGGALIPMDQVKSQALDQSAQQGAQLAQMFQRQAMQRYGSAVAGGANNSGAALADTNLQNQANALRQAVMAQQGLQLQQYLGSAGIASDLGKSANSLMGSYAALGGDIARASASNIGSGIQGMASGAQLSSTNLLAALQAQANAGRMATDNLGNALAALSNANGFASRNLETATGGIQGILNNNTQNMQLGMDAIFNGNKIASSNIDTAARTLLGLQGNQISAGNGLNNTIGLEFGNLQSANSNLINGANSANGIVNNAINAGLTARGQDTSTLNTLLNQYGSVGGDLIKSATTGSMWNDIISKLVGGVGGGLLAGLAGKLLNPSNPSGGGIQTGAGVGVTSLCAMFPTLCGGLGGGGSQLPNPFPGNCISGWDCPGDSFGSGGGFGGGWDGIGLNWGFGNAPSTKQTSGNFTGSSNILGGKS